MDKPPKDLPIVRSTIDPEIPSKPPEKRRGFLRRYWLNIAFFFGVFGWALFELSFAYRNNGQDEAPAKYYLRVGVMAERSRCPNKAHNALVDGYLTYAEALAVFRCHNRKDEDDEYRLKESAN